MTRGLRDLERRIGALASDMPETHEIELTETIIETGWEPSDGSDKPEPGTMTARYRYVDGEWRGEGDP